MSGLSKEQKEEVRRAQEAFLQNGGKVTKCPKHATGTGNIRFNFATRAYKKAKEEREARAMQEVRDA